MVSKRPQYDGKVKQIICGITKKDVEPELVVNRYAKLCGYLGRDRANEALGISGMNSVERAQNILDRKGEGNGQ